MAIYTPWDYKHDNSAVNNFSTNIYNIISGTGLELRSALSSISINGTAGTHTTPSMSAQPFFVGGPGIASMRLALKVQTLGTANARLAIYDNFPVENNNIYPNNLIIDYGEIAINSTGYVTTSLETVNLTNGLYWSVIQFDGGTGTVARIANNNGDIAVLGGTSTGTTFSTNVSLYINHTYGAFPSSFPAGAVYTTIGTPVFAGASIAIHAKYD